MDDGCICGGNWRLIAREYMPLMDSKYVRQFDGDVFTFFGLVLCPEDYYYGLSNDDDGTLALLSCVGSIEGHGYDKIADKASPVADTTPG